MRTLTLFMTAAALALTARAAPAPLPRPKAALPVGRWHVQFANGVQQVCEIRKDRSASVVEPLRASTGKVELKGGAAVIRYKDDRVERWRRVGRKMVVEHWFPGRRFPAGTPVRGLAKPAR
jgi:hypothetical protein